MERMPPLRRVRGVYQPTAETAASTTPSLVGDPLISVAVYVTPSFDSFYLECRDRIGRALTVTLRNVELAADVVDEAMVPADQHRAESPVSRTQPAGSIGSA